MSTTLYHPELPDVSRDVEDAQVDRWKAQGWKSTPASAPKEGTKEALVEQAKQLGIDPEGNKDEIEARIAAYRAGSHGTIVG